MSNKTLGVKLDLSVDKASQKELNRQLNEQVKAAKLRFNHEKQFYKERQQLKKDTAAYEKQTAAYEKQLHDKRMNQTKAYSDMFNQIGKKRKAQSKDTIKQLNLQLNRAQRLKKTDDEYNKTIATRINQRKKEKQVSHEHLIQIRKVQKALKKTHGDGRIAHENVLKLNQQIKKLEQARGTDKFNMRLKETNQNLKEATRNGHTFGQMLKENIKKFINWITVTTLIYGAVRALQGGIKTIIELDSAMIDLKKVTDETDESYQSFLVTANQTAKAIGHTTEAAIKATTEFAKLGYSLKQAQELASSALIYSNIGDVDIEESTKSIIGTMKGFGMEASQVTSILDKFNEVGNTAAITSGGIGDALQRSSSSLSVANNTLDESIGLIVAANSSVRDTTKVGTGLKTISMRLRGVSEESGEAIPKVQELIQSLSGVDIMKDENTFKSTYEILTDISKVWDKLTDVKKAGLIEVIAGKRQGDILASLMNNIQDGIKATETSLNSAGSAAKEQAKFMESINAKINVFKETVTGFWTNVIDNSQLKLVIDLATGFVNVLNVMVKAFGGVGTTIIIAVAAMSALNKEFVLGTVIQNVWTASKLGGVGALKAFTAALFSARAGLIAMNVIMSIGIVGAITLVTMGLMKLVDAFVLTNKEIEENFAESKKAVRELTEEVNKTGKAIKILQDTASSTQELAKAREDLISTLGEGIIEGYDLEGKAILKENGYLEDMIALKKEELKLKRQEEQRDVQKLQEKLEKDFKKQQYEIELFKQRIEYLKQEGAFDASKEARQRGIEKIENKLNGVLIKRAQTLSTLRQNNEVYGEGISITAQEVIEQLKAEEDVNNELGNKKELIRDVNAIMNDVKETTESYTSTMDSLGSAYQTLNEDEELSLDTMLDLIDTYPEVANYINEENDLNLEKGELLKRISEIQHDARVQELENLKASAIASRDEADKFVSDQIDKMKALRAFAIVQAAVMNPTAMFEALKSGKSPSFSPSPTAPYLPGQLAAPISENAVKEQARLEAQLKARQKMVDTIDAQLKVVKESKGASFNTDTKDKKGSREPSKISEYIDKTTRSYRDLEVQIEGTEHGLKLLNQELSTAEKGLQKIEIIKQINTQLAKQKVQLHSLAEAYRKEIPNITSKLEELTGEDLSGVFKRGVTDSTGVEKILGLDPKKFGEFLRNYNTSLTALKEKRESLNGLTSVGAKAEAKDTENKIKMHEEELKNLEEIMSQLQNTRDTHGEVNQQLELNLKNIKDINDEIAKLKDKEVEELIEKYYNTVKKENQDRMDALKNEQEWYSDFYDQKIKDLETENEAIEEQAKMADYIKDISQKQLDIEKERAKLANILQEKNIRILRAVGDGKYKWTWEADPKAIKESKERIDELLEEEKKSKEAKVEYERELQVAKDKELLEEKKRNSKDFYDNEIKKIQDFNDEIADSIDKQEDNLISYKDLVEEIGAEWLKNNKAIAESLELTEKMKQEVMEETQTKGVKNTSGSGLAYIKPASEGKMPSEIIADAKKEWQAASDRGDQAGMDRAHTKADRIRGFKTDASGTTKIGEFHTGLDQGFVGSPRLQKHEQIAKLLNGEVVMTPRQLENAVPNAMKTIKGTSNAASQREGDIVIHNLVVKSNNADDLMRQIRQHAKLA